MRYLPGYIHYGSLHPYLLIAQGGTRESAANLGASDRGLYCVQHSVIN